MNYLVALGIGIALAIYGVSVREGAGHNFMADFFGAAWIAAGVVIVIAAVIVWLVRRFA